MLGQTSRFARTRPSIWADFVKSIPDVKSATAGPLWWPPGAAKLGAVTLSPRALCVVICLAASACFGGPTSEWPAKGHDDESPHTPPPGAGASDGGGSFNPGRIDGGTAGSVADGRGPCEPSIDGGSDAGVDDPDDPSNPHDQHHDGPAAPDAGCR